MEKDKNHVISLTQNIQKSNKLTKQKKKPNSEIQTSKWWLPQGKRSGQGETDKVVHIYGLERNQTFGGGHTTEYTDIKL